jgi:hypothetical protein
MTKSCDSTSAGASLAATVAPEDLNAGDFVAVLSEVSEYPSFFWCDTSERDRSEPVRLSTIPQPTKPPLRIEAICLPYVFVKSPLGAGETIDIRLTQLARLDRKYAKVVWKSLRKSRPVSRRKSKLAP